VAKVALLIGISQYDAATLSPLPAAERDVRAMQRILENPEMGKFDQVDSLINPDLVRMQRKIDTLFSERTKDDLVVLFFSGHGIKDDRGRLYFSTPITCKRENGELERSTAVAASIIHDFMKSSNCKRQVVILDCCFSGAFKEGMIAKDDGSIDIRSQLGGEGTVVLTSSTATQYSFESKDSDLSIYTRYLVEGIETGAADRDHDGFISVDELHEYAEQKVQESAPAMKPEMHIFFKQGYKILLAKAPLTDPKLRYRIEADRFASRGEISPTGRYTLDILRERLSLSQEEATAIEADVLRPYQEYRESLRRYQAAHEQELIKANQAKSAISELTRAELAHLQKILGLRDEDIKLIEDEVFARHNILQTEEGQQRDLAESYIQALRKIQDNNWVEAVQILQEIVLQKPDYRDAVNRLAESRHQQELTLLGTDLEQAYAEQNWTEIVRLLEAIERIDPLYRNTRSQLTLARQQQKLASSYDRARQFYEARQWQRVIDEFAKIHAVNKAFPDPGGLWASALQRLRQEGQGQRQQRLSKLYDQGQRQIAKKEWRQALNIFKEIESIDSSYRDVKSQIAQLDRKLQRHQRSLVLFSGLVLIGWIVVYEVVSQSIILQLNRNLTYLFGGGVGGFLNGLFVSLALHQGYRHEIKQSLLWTSIFGAVGALAGVGFWFFLHRMSGQDMNQGFVKLPAILSALLGCATLMTAKTGFRNRRS
jgi:uncharacterized caspase-like protein